MIYYSKYKVYQSDSFRFCPVLLPRTGARLDWAGGARALAREPPLAISHQIYSISIRRNFIGYWWLQSRTMDSIFGGLDAWGQSPPPSLPQRLHWLGRPLALFVAFILLLALIVQQKCMNDLLHGHHRILVYHPSCIIYFRQIYRVPFVFLADADGEKTEENEGEKFPGDLW